MRQDAHDCELGRHLPRRPMVSRPSGERLTWRSLLELVLSVWVLTWLIAGIAYALPLAAGR